MRERGLKFDYLHDDRHQEGVVPHAGTWIEIIYAGLYLRDLWSFPTRERGLKCCSCHCWKYRNVSFPTRERGLKSVTGKIKMTQLTSFPTRECGLK